MQSTRGGRQVRSTQIGSPLWDDDTWIFAASRIRVVMRHHARAIVSALAVFVCFACGKQQPPRAVSAPNASHPTPPAAKPAVASAPLGHVGGELGAAPPVSQSTPPIDTQAAADVIYMNGVIIPMTSEEARGEALAVKAGKIVAVGTTDSVLRAHRGVATRVVDLRSQAVLPGFIDRGRLGRAALTSRTVSLAAPPLGQVGSIADLLDTLRNQKGESSLGDWIIGSGFDGALLTDKRFPTREELDMVSSDRPVLVLHVSGRSASCNSACLSVAGYGATTWDPSGGIIRRKDKSREPNGIIEGTALTPVLEKVPRPNDEAALAALGAVLTRYAARGVTTVQDEAVAPSESALVADAASRGSLPIDVVTYVAPDAAANGNATYQNRLRRGGVHISLDGAVQHRAAWLSQPYLITADGPKFSYSGGPSMMDTQLVAPLEKAKQDGLQVLAHCHGDLAVEQFLRLSERVLGSDAGDRRWVLNAQTLREDQLDRAKKLPIMTAFFPTQIYYWGDLHRDSFLGPQRAENVSPAHWALEKEMRFTLYDDPVLAPPDPLLLLWSSTNRVTKSDQLLGPDQRISVYQALQALTVEGAYQLFEEKEKGTLEPGKRADLVIVAANPLTEPLSSLRSLEVVATVKDGVTVWPQ